MAGSIGKDNQERDLSSASSASAMPDRTISIHELLHPFGNIPVTKKTRGSGLIPDIRIHGGNPVGCLFFYGFLVRADIAEAGDGIVLRKGIRDAI